MKWFPLLFLACSSLEFAHANGLYKAPEAPNNSLSSSGRRSEDEVFLGQLIHIESNEEITYTPGNLLRAIEKDDRILAELLIKAGMDRNCPVPVVELGDVLDVFQFAVYKRHHTIAKMLLVFTNVNRNGRSRNKELTALHIAAMNSDFQMIAELLAAGFDANAISKEGCNPIFYAINCSKCFTLLFPHSALNFIINKGQTLLYNLIKAGMYEQSKQLLAFDDIAINQGAPLLHVAMACKSEI